MASRFVSLSPTLGSALSLLRIRFCVRQGSYTSLTQLGMSRQPVGIFFFLLESSVGDHSREDQRILGKQRRLRVLDHGHGILRQENPHTMSTALKLTKNEPPTRKTRRSSCWKVLYRAELAGRGPLPPKLTLPPLHSLGEWLGSVAMKVQLKANCSLRLSEVTASVWNRKS